MDEIKRLQHELEGAIQAAYAAPRGVNEWPQVNKLQAELNAAIEAAKSPDQREIERLTATVEQMQRQAAISRESAAGIWDQNADLRRLIGLHTGMATDKPLGLLAMDLELIRKSYDDLARAVMAGDMECAQRICINRNLPRQAPKTLTDDLARIGLTGDPQ